MIAKCLDDLLGRKVTRKDLNLKVLSIAEGVENICPGLDRLKKIQNVIIPNSVISIDRGAFWGCHNLKTIVIPKNVQRIGDDAFGRCESLESIVVDINNKIYDSRNDCNAIIRTKENVLLLGCDNTIIPQGVTRIEKDAFKYCRNMKKLKIPESLHKFSVKTFSCRMNIDFIEVEKENDYLDSRNDCNAIIRKNGNVLIYGCNNSTIPDGVECIDYRAFECCSGLNSIQLPDSVKVIGERAFAGSNINSIFIPNGIKRIEDGTFSGCLNLSSISLPSSVVSIGDSAFENCSILSTINIAYGLKSIGSYAFCGCQKLEEIFLPDSVESMGKNVFYPVSLIKKINIPKGSKKKFEILLPQYEDKLVEVTESYKELI